MAHRRPILEPAHFLALAKAAHKIQRPEGGHPPAQHRGVDYTMVGEFLHAASVEGA